MIEMSFVSKKVYEDPFNKVELSAVITDPESNQKTVSAYWAGGQIWNIRYSSSKIGLHKIRIMCSDTTNSELNDKEETIEIVEYSGDNLLLKHGPLKVSENKKYLQHIDKTPFFWLADTWWMGFTKRLKWPFDFKKLTRDRVKKGFTVIQIVAGLYPDMEPFDKRGANEAGFPWNKDFTCINPEYFDMVDQRIDLLVQSGLLPCIVGCWGFYIDFAGTEVLKKHWKYICARYGAYPVVWCMAGEALMPFYGSLAFSKEKSKKYDILRTDSAKRLEYQSWARKGWTEITAYLKNIDSSHHPITIHPTDYGHKMVDDPSLLDFDMLQTGHGSWNSFKRTVEMVRESVNLTPKMPTIDAEVCYEGIGGSNNADAKRVVFWSCMLSGAAGHSYGADGIWQVNNEDELFGASPQGVVWGNALWEDAYLLPGSKQLGISKKFLEKFDWWDFESHDDWCEPHSTEENRIAPYAAGISGEVRLFYIPFCTEKPLIKNIEKNVKYDAYYFNPVNGDIYGLGEVKSTADNSWTPEKPMPVFSDLLLVLERIF
jgi:hypothetical protein